MKSSVVIFLVIYLLLVVSCFVKGSEKKVEDEVYEIDYRGPETHNSKPPPETMHGRSPYIHHKTSVAGSAGALVGGGKN